MRETIVVRQQFTNYDRDLHPECINQEYLDYELVRSPLSSETCCFCYMEIETEKEGCSRKYKWLKKSDPKVKEYINAKIS